MACDTQPVMAPTMHYSPGSSSAENVQGEASKPTSACETQLVPPSAAFDTQPFHMPNLADLKAPEILAPTLHYDPGVDAGHMAPTLAYADAAFMPNVDDMAATLAYAEDSLRADDA